MLSSQLPSQLSTGTTCPPGLCPSTTTHSCPSSTQSSSSRIRNRAQRNSIPRGKTVDALYRTLGGTSYSSEFDAIQINLPEFYTSLSSALHEAYTTKMMMDPLDNTELNQQEKNTKLKTIFNGISALLKRLASEDSKTTVLDNWQRYTEEFKNWGSDGTMKLYPTEFITRVYERTQTAKESTPLVDENRGRLIVKIHELLNVKRSKTEKDREKRYREEDWKTAWSRYLRDVGKNATLEWMALNDAISNLKGKAQKEDGSLPYDKIPHNELVGTLASTILQTITSAKSYPKLSKNMENYHERIIALKSFQKRERSLWVYLTEIRALGEEDRRKSRAESARVASPVPSTSVSRSKSQKSARPHRQPDRYHWEPEDLSDETSDSLK